MAHRFLDRIRDTTTTTGSGDLTLSAATPPIGYRLFSTLTVGDTIWCVVANQTVDEWLSGRYTYSATNTLTLTEVLQSSNSNAAVTWSAGTKDVYAIYPGTIMNRHTSYAGLSNHNHLA